MHTDRTLRLDILEQKDTILRSTVDRRHGVSRFIRPKNNGSMCTTNQIRGNKGFLPDRNESKIEATKLFSNLFKRRAYGQLILVFPVEHGTVSSITAKEHFHLLRLDCPRGPERLESVEDPAPREVLAGCASQLELLSERSGSFYGIGDIDGNVSVIPPVQAVEAVRGDSDRGEVVVVA